MTAKRQTATPQPIAVDVVDTSFLETLLGYNTRRAALTIIGHFVQHMAAAGLSSVEFSVLSLIHHNPGITSRQLCQTLSIQAPNLVKLIATLDARDLIERAPHPTDRRAQGLHLTQTGLALVQQAEPAAAALEQELLGRLSPAQQQQLARLLQAIYKPAVAATKRPAKVVKLAS
jgi:DNA-binding MarR family transcriptional regulator